MKKKIILFTATFLSLFAAFGQAKDVEPHSKVEISANSGVSFMAIVLSFESFNENLYTGSSSSNGAYQLAVDYFFEEKHSLGAAFAFEKVNAEFLSDFVFYGLVESKIARTRNHLGIRYLYHYLGVDNKYFSISSGLRVGVNIQTDDIQNTYADIDNNGNFYTTWESKTESDFRPAFQLILGRFVFSPIKNFGLNAEIALGSPYFFSLGLTGRF